MEVLQLSVSKRRLNSSGRSAKLRSRRVDNNRRKSPSKLRLSSSCNFRIINRRNSSLSSIRSVDNNRRSPGKLRLSSSCNIRISNIRNNSLSSRRRSAGNLPLSSRLQQPLQQEEPSQSPLQKGNKVRKPLSKDEILNCVNGTEQD
jgi:hypothetical protein